MTTPLAVPDLATFVSTRDALHSVAEHVLAKARYIDDREIRLTAFTGGFATPLLGDGTRVRVDARDIDIDIVVDGAGGERRSPLTTVGGAAEFVGVEPGFPADLYPPATPLHADSPLGLDRVAARVLAAWYGFSAEVLAEFSGELTGQNANPSPLILWPEHFDQAFFTEDVDESRRANYGASPGDDGHPEPYLYVGPWGAPAVDEFWNAAHFDGAVLPLSTLVATTDPTEAALEFLRTGRALLASR
jgi:hypothetical protein